MAILPVSKKAWPELDGGGNIGDSKTCSKCKGPFFHGYVSHNQMVKEKASWVRLIFCSSTARHGITNFHNYAFRASGISTRWFGWRRSYGFYYPDLNSLQIRNQPTGIRNQPMFYFQLGLLNCTVLFKNRLGMIFLDDWGLSWWECPGTPAMVQPWFSMKIPSVWWCDDATWCDHAEWARPFYSTENAIGIIMGTGPSRTSGLISRKIGWAKIEAGHHGFPVKYQSFLYMFT